MKNKNSLLLLWAVAVLLGASCDVAEASARSKRVAAGAAAFRPRRHVVVPPPSSALVRTAPADVVAAGSSLSEEKVAAKIRGGAVVENTLLNAISGSVVMALIEKGVKEIFKANNIGFPSQLGACLVLFASLLLMEVVNPKLANTIFTALSPGAALLAKWLPVFFVPGLAMLPLAPSIGDTSEVRASLSTVCSCLIFS